MLIGRDVEGVCPRVQLENTVMAHVEFSNLKYVFFLNYYLRIC